eukprot:gnl/Dysnectes_brevis/5567_a8068_644.p2 GENE.gnl/Dysnectes_brevis/5567_a8068_644~~gnl/Dysnectes_brevis/5567_a8068_644.p2  ORF type:complete len:173 (-),score=47.47 gnl/Dysnectes_brevis/5567_a8068_644:22-540(-)
MKNYSYAELCALDSRISPSLPPRVLTRLQKERKYWLKHSQAFHRDGLVLKEDSTLLDWLVQVSGPADTPYAGHTYSLRVIIPHKFPFSPPIAVFTRPEVPPHPHIYSNGHICLSYLGQDWSPALTVEGVIRAIQSLLGSGLKPKRPRNDAGYCIRAKALPGERGWIYDDDKV